MIHSPTLQAAQNAEAAGQIEQAAKYYLAAYLVDPTNYGLLKSYAYAGQAYDRPKVIEVIQSYIDANPSPKHVALGYDLLLPYLEAERRIAAGLSDYSAVNPLEAPFTFSPYENRAYYIACREWAHEAKRASGTSHHPFQYFASASFIIGDYGTTQKWLDQIRRQAEPRIAAVHLQGEFMKGLGAAAEKFKFELPYMVDRTNIKRQRRVFVGCDMKYLRTYGTNLAKSFFRSGTDAGLHFHVFLDEIIADNYPSDPFRAISPEITFSIEFVELPHNYDRKFYYAPIRLNRMLELVERDGVPTVMLDCDLLVHGNLDSLFDQLETCDAVVCRMPGRIPYHTQFNASVFGINPTHAGRRYLRQMAGYIAKCFAIARIPWCLDQISIMAVMHHMRATDESIQIEACGPQIYDGTPQAALWPQKVVADSPYLPTVLESIRSLAMEAAQ